MRQRIERKRGVSGRERQRQIDRQTYRQGKHRFVYLMGGRLLPPIFIFCLYKENETSHIFSRIADSTVSR